MSDATIDQSYTVQKTSYVLAATQLFSTIGFAVLWSTLVLYLTQSLKFNDTIATGIVATFSAFNYGLHLLGGYFGGRLMSNRKLFVLGVLLQVIGCFTIAQLSLSNLYWGLAIFLTGSGLNVTCLNMMLTQLFKPDDKRRENAFLLNYSMMNLGFMLGFIVAGHYQLSQNFHSLFMFAGYGSAIAIVLLLLNWKQVADRKTAYALLPKAQQLLRNLYGLLFIAVLLFALKYFIAHPGLSNHLVILVGIVMLGTMLTLAIRQPDAAARYKMFAYIILSIAALSFWVIYQMLPMSLTLFADRNVNLHFLGYVIAPQWLQNINAVIIIIGGPLLGIWFKRLRDRGRLVSIPLQFSAALLLTGIGIALLPIGIAMAQQGITHINWLIIAYIFQSVGELLIGPIGYAMIGQLAPAHLQGLMMGTWMMVNGVAATIVHYVSKFAMGNIDSVNPVLTNPGYSYTFNLLGWTAIGFGVLLLLINPWLNRLTGEK